MVELDIHATEIRQIELCRRYWQLDEAGNFFYKVADLAREYSTKKHELPQIVAAHCDAISTTVKCAICNRPYVYTSRADFQQKSRFPRRWTCSSCEEEMQKQEREEFQIQQQKYRQLIQERYKTRNPGPIDLRKLSLSQAVYLASFIRLCSQENFAFAASLESASEQLSPTTELSLQILSSLYEAGLIAVSPNSPLEAFEGDAAEKFYLSKVFWLLPFGTTSENVKDFASALEAALKLRGNWPSEWRHEQLSLWQQIALHECLQYLTVALQEHDLNLNPGEKTHAVIAQLLSDYSTAQIMNFIWRAAKDAAAFWVREKVTKQHAANTVVGAIQRYAERAKTENWDIKPYRRHFSCPQSVVSHVLFNSALQIGDKGFDKKPSEENLNQS